MRRGRSGTSSLAGLLEKSCWESLLLEDGGIQREKIGTLQEQAAGHLVEPGSDRKSPLSRDFDPARNPWPRILDVVLPSSAVIDLRMQEVYFPAKLSNLSHIRMSVEPEATPINRDEAR